MVRDLGLAAFNQALIDQHGSGDRETILIRVFCSKVAIRPRELIGAGQARSGAGD